MSTSIALTEFLRRVRHLLDGRPAGDDKDVSHRPIADLDLDSLDIVQIGYLVYTLAPELDLDDHIAEHPETVTLAELHHIVSATVERRTTDR